MLQYDQLNMNCSKRFGLLTLFLTAALFIGLPGIFAQDNPETSYPEYVIQEGDFLSIVAQMFNTTVDDILAVNDITDVNAISIGSRVKIPTLPGLEGTISTRNINVGDTLSSLSILSGMPRDTLANINNIVSPTELYIGSMITTIENPDMNRISAVSAYEPGSTLLEQSARLNQSPIALQKKNQALGAWDFADQQILFAELDETQQNPVVHAISPLVDVLEIKQLPLVQGETHVIHVSTAENLTLSGMVGTQNLRFFHDADTPGDWYAMLGIDAMADTGLTNFSIKGISEDGSQFSVDQQIIVQAGVFTNEVVEGVDPSTLQTENQQLDTQTVHSFTETSDTRSWGQYLSYPVDSPCFASGFGNRRSYNDGTFYNYHTGTDFSVCEADNINIYAAADGTVLFASELPIHGNYTMIDHGWGVYTSYSHQSQILVTAGQQVKRGDLIGLIGNTGRSVGPHLHWEVLINSVNVNPMTWLNTQFP